MAQTLVLERSVQHLFITFSLGRKCFIVPQFHETHLHTSLAGHLLWYSHFLMYPGQLFSNLIESALANLSQTNCDPCLSLPSRKTDDSALGKLLSLLFLL